MEVTTKLLVISVMACLLIALGGVMKPIMEAVFPIVMSQQLTIKEGRFVYDLWKEVPIPGYMQFFTMAVVNPLEFMQGEPPYIVQKGPYTYREYRPKVNVTPNDNYTITYYNMKSYVFEPELSVGPDTEKFTTVNLAVFTVAHWLKTTPDSIKDMWKLVHALSGAELMLDLSINELMWGYDDAYLELAQKILGKDLVPSTKFGLFIGANNSDDGLWTVFTGEDNINKVAQIDKWNGVRSLSWWATDEANMINGSDGSQTHPYLKKDEVIYMFLPLACSNIQKASSPVSKPPYAYYRSDDLPSGILNFSDGHSKRGTRSGYAVFDKDVKVTGISTHRFVAPPSMVATPEENPENIGFCVPDNTSCPLKGLIDGSSCYFNAPVFLSMPHFLYGDDTLYDMVHGLTPNKEEHEIYLSIDPLSGVTFDANLRAQMSIKVEAYKYISGSEFISDAYLPVVWLNETFTLTEEYASLYQMYVNIATYTTLVIMCICIFGGIGMLLGVGISFYRNRRLPEEQLHFNNK